MEFLSWCKARYKEGNTPSNLEFRQTPEYTKVKDFAFDLVNSKGLESLYLYTIEGNYLVNLWASHLVLELFEPSNEMREECIKIIRRYFSGRLNKRIAEEEKEWLSNYLS